MKKLIITLAFLLTPVAAHALSPVLPATMTALRPSTMAYFRLSGTNGTQRGLDTAIRSIELGAQTGITLASVVANFDVTASPFATRATYTSATVPSNDLRWLALISGVQLTVNDGTNSMTLTPVAPGTGETYLDLVNGNTLNGNMEAGDPPTGWLATNATFSSAADERTGGAGSKSLNFQRDASGSLSTQAINANAGELINASGWVKRTVGTDNNHSIGIRRSGAWVFRVSADAATPAYWAQYSGYGTVAASSSNLASFSVGGSIGNADRFDDVIFRRTLTPDATGFTASGLTLGSFNPNAASFTLTVRKP